MSITIPRDLSRNVEVSSELPELTSTRFFTSADHFLEFAIDSALALVNASAGSLFLWDEMKKALIHKTGRGPHCDRFRNVHIRLREGISGWVGETGESLLVKNIHQDGRFSQLKRAGNYKSPSFISLPLIASNKLLGVINITERENYDTFNESDLEKARLFGQYIAIALENIRLSSRLQAENHSLNEKVAFLEETLKAQEPLVSIGKLASNLAHELNNPLDSIRRYVNLALDQVMDDSLSRQYILKAKEGIYRAVKVIRGLLQFSRESSKSERRESSLHSVIEKSIQCVTNDHAFNDIKIVLDFDKKDSVVVDYGLYVVFRNLLKNAHHAMNGRGTLTISTRETGSQLSVSIKDTGCGMPSYVQAHLFEPFFTTKENEGTGIGLTICREIVHKCGGTICCKSQEGVGTEFLITLPSRSLPA